MRRREYLSLDTTICPAPTAVDNNVVPIRVKELATGEGVPVIVIYPTSVNNMLSHLR
jgi:predicted nuclease with RNAse H fold